jgi:hypothetical protein
MEPSTDNIKSSNISIEAMTCWEEKQNSMSYIDPQVVTNNLPPEPRGETVEPFPSSEPLADLTWQQPAPPLPVPPFEAPNIPE